MSQINAFRLYEKLDEVVVRLESLYTEYTAISKEKSVYCPRCSDSFDKYSGVMRAYSEFMNLSIVALGDAKTTFEERNVLLRANNRAYETMKKLLSLSE